MDMAAAAAESMVLTSGLAGTFARAAASGASTLRTAGALAAGISTVTAAWSSASSAPLEPGGACLTDSRMRFTVGSSSTLKLPLTSTPAARRTSRKSLVG
jgi:hypothetical protein